MKIYQHKGSRAVICVNEESAVLVHGDVNQPDNFAVREAVRKLETDDQNIFILSNILTAVAASFETPPLDPPREEPTDPT